MPASRRKASNFEVADYDLDVDWVRWRKKIRRGGINRAVFGSEDDQFDKDYITLLDNLLGFRDLKGQQQQVEDDPAYAMFLENFVEHENSYILDVPLEHGVLFPLKYEGKDDVSNKLKSCRSSLMQKSGRFGANSDLEARTENSGFLKEGSVVRKRSRSSMVGELKSGQKDSGSGKENTEISSPKIPKILLNAQKKNSVGKPSQKVGCSSGQDRSSNSGANTVKNSYGVLITGLKVKGQLVFSEYSNGKRVFYEDSDHQKSTDVQNGPSQTVLTAQIQSSRPPVPAPRPRQTTPTLGASHQQKLTDVQHDLEPSKTVHTTQIQSSRPPVAVPTPRQTTPTLRVLTRTRSRTPRPLTAKNLDKVAKRISEVACTTQISTRALIQSPTPTARARTSTFTATPESGQDHGLRVARTKELHLVFICGLEAHRESILHEYGDGKGKYHQQKSTDVRNKPLKTAPTMQIPTFRPPTRSPNSSQPNAITRTPASTHAPKPRSITAKGHCGVQRKPSETASKAQILVSRPPTPCPSQPAAAPSSTPTVTTSSYSPFTRTNVNEMLMSKQKAAQRCHASFLKKLEHICRKPFEQKEYEDLLAEVNVRKPILSHKDTRGGGYGTATGELAKSYLDNYPDLVDEIKKVESDPKKVLNLLRGFVFYLLYVPHGITSPWRNTSCMAVMLGSA